jgi:ABC-2 type transport system permease protein
VSTHAAPVDRLGPPVRGPSALGGSLRRFVHLTWTLAVLDWKLKFFGSVLGYLWQLMKPLMLFGVLYVVFTEFVRLGGGVRFYPAILLAGIVMYTFFAEATSAAVGSVVDKENLVRKIQFPRMVIPLSVVLTAYLNFLLNFVAVVVFILISGVDIRVSWLEIVPLVLILGALCTGLAMFLSANYVRFRDVRPIWDVLATITFYATPILYPLDKIPNEQVQKLLLLNPLAAIVQETRHALIDPQAPSAAEVMGGGERLLIPAFLVVVICVVGYLVFDRAAPRIAEEL